MLKENNPTQRNYANILSLVSTVNEIENEILKRLKNIMFIGFLSAMLSRIFYEKQLTVENKEKVVTIDEAWVYLSDYNKKVNLLL